LASTSPHVAARRLSDVAQARGVELDHHVGVERLPVEGLAAGAEGDPVPVHGAGEPAEEAGELGLALRRVHRGRDLVDVVVAGEVAHLARDHGAG
jgi:hypothetical protein